MSKCRLLSFCENSDRASYGNDHKIKNKFKANTKQNVDERERETERKRREQKRGIRIKANT